eukprot:scaffold1717_cov169-Amphora_coffeaeformis.AAC.10
MESAAIKANAKIFVDPVPEEKDAPNHLPQNITLNGSVQIPHFHTTSKGEIKERSKAANGNDLTLHFRKVTDQGATRRFAVQGRGNNARHGAFYVEGTATSAPNSDPKVEIRLQKYYLTDRFTPNTDMASRKRAKLEEPE